MKTRDETKFIAVHCTATRPTLDIGVKEIDQWHKTLGWRGCGYHDVIRRNGALEFGRDINEVGAHVAGYNSISIGVCLVGGVDSMNKPENNFTDAQFKTLVRVLRFYKALFPKAIIQGHRDFPNVKKDCPCFDVKVWLKDNPF
jgi:hypothetical protein